MAWVLLAKTALSLFYFQMVRAHLQRGGDEFMVAGVGLFLLTMGLIGGSQSSNVWGVWIGIGLLGVSGNFYLPWIRKMRQELIEKTVDQNARNGVTGVLISVESLSYLVSAVLLWMYGANLQIVSYGALVLACLGGWLIYQHSSFLDANRVGA